MNSNSHSSLHMLRVMVIDPSPDVLLAELQALQGSAYSIEGLASVEQALQQLHQCPPDLIILNRDWPDDDGLEMCKKIKSSPALEGIFVLLISSTHTQGADQADGLDAGADGYVARPICQRALIARVQSFARIIRRASNQQAPTCLERLETSKALKESRESEAYFHTLFENAPDAFYLIDGGLFIDANEQGLKAFGCANKADIIGKSPLDFSPETQPSGEKSKHLVKKKLKEARHSKPLPFEWLHVLKDGTELYCELSLLAIQSSAGKTLILVICHDITERKRMQDALKQAHERKDEAIEAADVGLFSIDLRSDETNFSPIWKRQLGYKDDEFPNDLKVLDQHIHPDDLQGVQNELLRIIANESKSWEQRFRMRHKNGNYRWIFCRARVVEYVDGKAARLLGSHIDVTDRVETQAALKDALESQQEAIEAGNVGLWRMNTKTKEVFYSAQWKRQIGYADHEFPNDFALWEQHVHPNDLEQVKGKLLEAIANKQSGLEATYRMRHKDGSYRWILTRGRITEIAQDGTVKVVGSHIDLTKQIESQAALEASERHLRLAQRMAGMGSWEWSPTTDAMVWSKEVFHLWGYVPGEVELKLEAISAHIHPEDLAPWQENRRACLEDGKEHDIEIRVLLPNGKTRWVASYGNVIRDESGAVILMAGVFMDISEHKQMKEDLRQRERQLSTLMNNLPGMAYRCENNTDWTPRFISSGAEALTGYTSEEFMGEQAISYNELIVPEDRDRVRSSAEQSLAQKGRAELEYRIQTASGEIRHVWEQGISVTDPDGKHRTHEGIIMDVTEQVHTKQHLQRLTEILRSLRAVNQLITHTNSPRTLIHKATETLVRDRGFQHAWCILVDDKEQIADHAEAVVDDSVIGISKHLVAGKIPACYEETLRTSEVLTFPPNSARCVECCFHVKTNDQIRLCGRLNYEGKTYGMLSVTVEPNATRIHEEESLFKEVCNDLAFALHNIDRELEKRQIYDDMAIAKNQAETANRAKNDFLAVMSHEMRTPLNPIMGYASLMLESASKEDSKLLQSILDSSKRMLRLVDRILEYSELERSSAFSVIRKFKLVDACQSAFEELRCETAKFDYRFQNGGFGLLAIDETLEVCSDRKMLIRILGNLLQNACKYTQHGNVTLTIGQKIEALDATVFQFVITDTGIGMEEATWSKYFEAFTQADSSYSRPYEGVGLGLAICSKLITALKGSIEVSSKIGEGSQFTVSLPMQVLTSTQSLAQLPADLVKPELKFSEPLNVLIVEDDVYNSSLAKAFISKLGGVAAVAPNGSVAVELCKRQTFDSILMDIRMPVMDGFEATALIKKEDQLNTQTPIIALTANGADSVEHQCQELGMSAFMQKPIHMRELHTVLQQIRKQDR